jgi:hypothetical protein
MDINENYTITHTQCVYHSTFLGSTIVKLFLEMSKKINYLFEMLNFEEITKEGGEYKKNWKPKSLFQTSPPLKKISNN